MNWLQEEKVADSFNNFFSNFVLNLKIPEFQAWNKFYQKIKNNPTLKAVLKYRDHPGLAVIKHIFYRLPVFYFSCVDKNSVIKEIRKLNINKDFSAQHC